MGRRRPVTDLELIEHCLDGRQEYFAELIARYKNLVFSIILRMTKDSEEANDLAQDVFLKMYRNLASYSPEFKFSTWVMRITTNHVIDFRRKRKQETMELDAAAADPEEGPEAAIIRKEENELIQKLIDGLPSMYKIPIIMYHQEDMSYQEIADKIDEPLSKVKNRIFRGRKMLKSRYIEERR
jgi:RNA polymerase sigma-70 factor (ECF subfamily)